MAREFTVRVSEPLAGWVRTRPLSHTELLGRIALAVELGRIPLALHDPGPGPERITVRLPQRALPGLRTLAESRENCTAIRKLFETGFQARALPVASRMALPGKRLGVGECAGPLSLPESVPELSDASAVLLAGFFAGDRLAEDLAIVSTEPEFASSTPGPSGELTLPCSPVAISRRVPLWVMALGLGILILLLVWLLRGRAAPVAEVAAALPQKAVRAWVPSAMSKLAGGVWS